MSHVLVRWTTEEKWDVYSVRAIKDEGIAARLSADPDVVHLLHGAPFLVEWDNGEDKAFIVDAGTEKQMEKKRNIIVQKHMEVGPWISCCTHGETAKKLMPQGPPAMAQQDKVDIGAGVLVETSVLARLSAHHTGNPRRYPRDLLRAVFTEDELKGKSLTGRRANAHKEKPQKEGLDPVRLNAVIGYTCAKFGVPPSSLKNSLSNMLIKNYS